MANSDDLLALQPTKIATPSLDYNGDEVMPFSDILDIDNLPADSERPQSVAYSPC